jgi:hypothetical protein
LPKEIASPRDFNDLLIDSVDEVVTEVLGPKVSSVFWRQYQAFLGITREEMPNQLPRLFASLDMVFGRAGETFGDRVVRRLYEKANVPLKNPPRRTPLENAEELRRALAKVNKHLTP